ncbi:MAG: tetratricopeptide repeat protein [Fusobacteriaceae bacterium]
MRVKKIELLLFLLLSGCTALDNNFNNKNSIYSELGKINLENNRNLRETPINKILTNEEIKFILNEIKNNWSMGEIIQSNSGFSNNIEEINVGQYLKIENLGIKKVEIVGADPSQYEILNRDGIYFRALYAGEYILKLDRLDGSYSIVKVKNNVKYDFTERETYDIILSNYKTKNYAEALSAIDLYKILFSKSYINKELDFLALEISLSNGDLRESKELQNNLKSKGTLNSDEIIILFKNELKINGNQYNVENYYINNSKTNSELKNLLKDHILAKNKKTESEKKFIEELYLETSDPSLKSFEEKVISLEKKEMKKEEKKLDSYINMDHLEMPAPKNEARSEKNLNTKENEKRFFNLGILSHEKGRYSEAVIQFEKISQNSRDYDTYFYLGDSYFKNEKYQKSIENYNKYLQSQEMNIKKAEARYNLAVSYDKLGNKKEAENALKKVIELFPGTSWSRKSNIYMIKLKNN